MIGPVAIATENDDFDAEVYRVLLELVLQDDVERWSTQMRFSGWQSIEKRINPYLRGAEAAAVRYVLVAVDNDGGASRHPEHEDSHDPPTEASNPDGCRECWLNRIVPAWWTRTDRHEAIVVPVQTVETWLLFLRGDRMTPSPEAVYHRRALKTAFFGKPLPPLTRRTELALEQVRRTDALLRLVTRPSFARFRERVLRWT